MLKLKSTIIYWNLYLRFYLETFLEIAIVGFLRLKYFRVTTMTECFLSVYALVTLLILASYMIGSVLFLRKRHREISLQAFKNRYGALTLGL